VGSGISEERSAKRIGVCASAEFNLSGEVFKMSDLEVVFGFEKGPVVMIDKRLSAAIGESNGRGVAILVQKRKVVVVPVFG
jgi:hypothetical protein